jgi:hypothetical protein
VTHPYREKLPDGPSRAPTPTRLDTASVAFGVACAIVVEAVAGPGCALGVGLVGVALLLCSPPMPRR